jgi:hypothetical protein
MKQFITKKYLIILGIVAVVVAAGAFVVFYFNTTTDPRYAIDCNYFERIADIHWAEAKVYDDFYQDAEAKGDISGAQALNHDQFLKQTLAEQWEEYYQECKNGVITSPGN